MPRKTKTEIINLIKELDPTQDIEELSKLQVHKLLCILEELDSLQVIPDDFCSRMGLSKN